MMDSHASTAILALLIMLLVAASNFINTYLLLSNNNLMIPILILSFVAPILLFKSTRDFKKYKLSNHLMLPKKHYIPTIIFSY